MEEYRIIEEYYNKISKSYRIQKKFLWWWIPARCLIASYTTDTIPHVRISYTWRYFGSENDARFFFYDWFKKEPFKEIYKGVTILKAPLFDNDGSIITVYYKYSYWSGTYKYFLELERLKKGVDDHLAHLEKVSQKRIISI
jgi:hypothetical protein